MDSNYCILIVDDQRELLENLSLALETDGHQTVTATDGLEALKLLQSQSIDLILADIAMPGMNGYQLYERIRENIEWVNIPFIFLTARSFDSDIRYGKELGVDDYLTKPIKPEDLLAAVRGRLRRADQLAQAVQHPAPPLAAKDSLLTVGPIQINIDQHRVWLDEKELKLSAREFLLLAHLTQNAGKVISAQALIKVTHQLETDHIEAGALLGPLMHALRRKLGAAVGETGLIENVRGVGYRLITHEE